MRAGSPGCRLGVTHLDAGLSAREGGGRVPRLLVVLAVDRAPVLAPVVLDRLERLARVATKKLVREDFADPRGRLDPSRAPVLVHELADERFRVRPAEYLHPVRIVAKRPKDQHILDPLNPAAILDRGAPLGEDALDVRAPVVIEPLDRFVAVLADEGIGNGMNEFRVCRHVMLPTGKNRSGPSRRLSPSSCRSAHRPLGSTPDGGTRTTSKEGCATRKCWTRRLRTARDGS